VSLWFGANDIFAYLDNALPTESGAIATAEAAAAAVAGAVGGSIARGIDVLLFNLPNLGLIPRFALFDPVDAEAATKASAAFNARLTQLIGAFPASAPGKVLSVDMASLFDELIDDPERFGLTDATNPCFIPNVSLCTPEQAADRAFFDQSHPSARLHQAIADAALAPIPLPASALLLGAGLAGLVMLRRRAA
jgi:outer membrane lipase/esterase